MCSSGEAYALTGRPRRVRSQPGCLSIDVAVGARFVLDPHDGGIFVQR
jgi:hypothetical protein